LRTIYEELPEEKTIYRESKSNSTFHLEIIKISEFEIKYKVGKGTFSTIYLAERKGRLYALKQLKKEELLLRNQMKYALTELRALIKCRKCKYIIPIYFAFQTPEFLYLTLEYVPTGDLSTLYLTKVNT
jgi:serine/threonine protein kinase